MVTSAGASLPQPHPLTGCSQRTQGVLWVAFIFEKLKERKLNVYLMMTWQHKISQRTRACVNLRNKCSSLRSQKTILQRTKTSKHSITSKHCTNSNKHLGRVCEVEKKISFFNACVNREQGLRDLPKDMS